MDHNLAADRWVNHYKKDTSDQNDDPNFCTIQSRDHLLYLMFYTSELISVAKGIRLRLTVIAGILLLCAGGIFSLGRFY